MLKDDIDSWSKENLKVVLLETIDHYARFEAFLMRELGEVTYLDLCKEFSMQETERLLQEMHMPDTEIKKIKEGFGFKETKKS